MINKIKQTLCIYKDLKKLLSGDFSTAVNTRYNNKNVIIPIFYWGNHNVSWLQIYFSIKFGAVGAKVFFVYDDDFAKRYRFTLKAFLVRRFIKILCLYSNYYLIKPELRNTEDDQFDEMILKKKYFNFQWLLKKSLKLSDFSLPAKEILQERPIAATIDFILKSKNFALCFCPGGIYGNSFFWRGLCDSNGVRFSSFDGDEEGLMVTPSGVGAHRTDVIYRVANHDLNKKTASKKVFDIVKLDIYQRSMLKAEKIKDLLQRRNKVLYNNDEALKFFDRYKKQYFIDNILDDVLIFLNTSWDGAALDLEPWKISQAEWLDLLMEELSENKCKRVKIRQHPDEKFRFSSDDYTKKIEFYQQKYPNIEVTLIKSTDTVSSYFLIEKANSVFTFSSTIGLESCFLMRPTFVFKNNYQFKLQALPLYSPGNLPEALEIYLAGAKEFERRSALAYYYGQIEGWYDISIPEFEQTLRDASRNRLLGDIALSVLSNDSY